MTVDTSEILSLPAAEQLRIVELIWDQLGSTTTAIPLPEWVEKEGQRRAEELRNNPSLGVDHDATWRRIESRNG